MQCGENKKHDREPRERFPNPLRKLSPNIVVEAFAEDWGIRIEIHVWTGGYRVMKLKLKTNRNIWKFILIAVGVILLGILFFYMMSVWESEYGAVYEQDDDIGAENDRYIYIDGVQYAPKKKLDTVLIIGVDKYRTQTTDDSYLNTEQADFLMLLLIDRANESCTALHLNRDTMADIPVLGVRGENAGTQYAQLALAHTYGSGGDDSCRNTVSAVEGLLYGIKIDHYISFTMDAVKEINDMAGGVTLTLLEDFTGIDAEMAKGSEVTLVGDMALTYVRSRYGLDDNTNLGRMERQRQYLTALRDKLTDVLKSDDTFFMKMLNTISNYMVSDCTAHQLSHIYEQTENYADGGFLSIKGEAVKGNEFMEFYVDNEALKQQVIGLFYEPVIDG